MSDREDIEFVIKLYGYILDYREYNRLAEVFATDGSFVVEGTDIACHGLKAIDHFMRTTPSPIAHYSTNILVDVVEGADQAHARAKAFAPRADGTALIATYLDKLVRTPAGWRLAERVVEVSEPRWTARAHG